MRKISFTWDSAAENRGVGTVERNTADSTTIRKQEKNFRQQKTITMGFVVERKKDLKKTNTVEEDVQDIAQPDGKLTLFLRVALWPVFPLEPMHIAWLQ